MTEAWIRTPFPSTRLILILDGSRWFLGHRGRYHGVEAAVGVRLAEWLPLDVLPTAVTDAGPVDVDIAEERVELRFVGAEAGDVVAIEATPVELLTSVGVDPAPSPDGWVPTSFRVAVEGADAIALHFFLPEVEGLASKRCVVASGGSVLVDDALARGEETTFEVELASGTVSGPLEVELEYPEPAASDEKRELGAVISGISRRLRRDEP